MEEREKLQVIGTGVRRIDGYNKANGSAEFIQDMDFANLLESAVLYSPYASAKILKLDTTKAWAIPGVVAIVTGEDARQYKPYGTTIHDRPILAIDQVRFVGEPVAAVAATSLEIAQQAVDAIEVEYEETPAVFDPEEAAKPDAPIIHPGMMDYQREKPVAFPVEGSNICSHFKIRKGDVEEAFKRAHYIAEDTFEIPRNHHACLETFAMVGQVEREGTLHIWTGNQSPYVLQRGIANLFHLPWNKVRITIPTLGGGFGSKIYPSLEPLIVLLAKAVGHRPVRLSLDREHDFLRNTNHGCRMYLKTAVDAEGKIIGRKLTTYWDTGAYADCGPLVARNSGFTSAGPYEIENVQVDAYAVYTNLPVATAFRGYGIPHVTWAYERQLEYIAKALNMDPLAIRRKNIVREGAISHTGETLTAVGMESCMDAVAKAAGIDPEHLPEPKYLGDGIYESWGASCSWKGSMRHYGSSAFVRIMEEGSISVNVSNVDMGQGSRTVFAQIAAEELGADISRVVTTKADTLVTPYDRTTSASRGTFHAGTAVMNAAKDAYAQLRVLASEALKCDVEDIEKGKDCLYNRKTGESLGYDIIMKKAILGGNEVIGRGYSKMSGGTGLDPEKGQGTNPTSFWMYSSDLAHIRLDTRTGQVELLDLYAANDVGKALNPANCVMQIHGAAMMGMGGGIMEELKFDKSGRLLNNNLHDFKIPTASDIPEIHALLVEVPHPIGPYGAKGLGEAPVGAVAPAVANAIYRATGVKMNRLPLKPETVKMELVKAGAENA